LTSIDPAVLLNYRLAVARIGERDLFHWWESNALTEEGQFALRRLFRHSFVFVAFELALEAARVRHEVQIPPGPRLTLFNLGPEIEDSFRSWVSRAKAENEVETFKVRNIPEAARTTVADALAALNIQIERVKSKEVGDRAIHACEVEHNELRTDTLRIIRMLLGAYLHSGVARFVAPYITEEFLSEILFPWFPATKPGYSSSPFPWFVPTQPSLAEALGSY